MTTRERHLAVILVSIIGVGLFGFLAYYLVIGPWIEKDKQIKLRQNEVAQLELDILEIQAQKKKFEAARQQSLPADVGVSRTQYSNLLEGLLRRADFEGGSFKITVSEPDTKSAPTIAPKKPAYTRLNYDITLKGELYHLVDFMQLFYSQPLLHSIKMINVQRPSDQRSQLTRQLDVTMKIEALVLDNAYPRPTLLPIVRELGLLSGAAAQTGYNLYAASGRGSAVPPAGVLADSQREYLAVAARDMFFGPRPERKQRDTSTPAEDDISQFVVLTSITGYDDGSVVASFRDQMNDHDYTVTQTADGKIEVRGVFKFKRENEKEIQKRSLPGYSLTKPPQDIIYGTEEGQNLRTWRVRRVTLGYVIVERVDSKESGSRTRVPFIGAMAGGLGSVVAVPRDKVFKVKMGESLKMSEGYERTRKPLEVAEAWKEIYGPAFVPATEAPMPVEVEDGEARRR
jgi:hypothetical protein